MLRDEDGEARSSVLDAGQVQDLEPVVRDVGRQFVGDHVDQAGDLQEWRKEQDAAHADEPTHVDSKDVNMFACLGNAAGSLLTPVLFSLVISSNI